MKKLISLLLTLIMAFSLVSCSEPATEETATDTIDVSSLYPVTVTDQAGRSVTIESEPERLVSGYYISTSTVLALGAKDKLVGIEAKAKSREIYALSAPEIIDLPNVGSAKEFDLEGCIALSPDLVVLPLKLKDAANAMEEMGIDVILVNPENNSLLSEMISLLGVCLNKENKAEALLNFSEREMKRLTNSLSNAENPTVYLAGNSALLSTAGSSMYQSGMINLAGGVNVADEITDSYWVEISYEQLLDWNPDYIILASDASYSVDDVLNDENLSGLNAVANKNVYQMPDKAEAWDSPVPAGVLGSVWLSSILHEKECPVNESEEIIDEYYETFYNFTYSEN